MVYKVDDKDILSNINQYNNHLPSVNNLDLCKLIHYYQKAVPNFIPRSFPLKQNVEHAIETGNAKPININAYPLSKLYIDK